MKRQEDSTSFRLDPKIRDKILNDLLIIPTVSEAETKSQEQLEDFLWTGEQDEEPIDNSLEYGAVESSGSASGPEGGKWPEEEFLVRTVLQSNMTVIHNAIEGFKREMENKLTRAYRRAYVVNRFKRGLETTTMTSIAEDETTTFIETVEEAATTITTTRPATIRRTITTTTSPNEDATVTSTTKPASESVTTTENVATSTEVVTTKATSESAMTTTIENVMTSTEAEVTTEAFQENFVDLSYFTNQEADNLNVNEDYDDDNRQPRRENGDEKIVVGIYNIRSSLPKPEIEMIYSVSRGNTFTPVLKRILFFFLFSLEEIFSRRRKKIITL